MLLSTGGRRLGKMFLEQFGSLVIEGIEIVGECVDDFQRIDHELKIEGEAMAKHAKKAIRTIIKHEPAIFDSREKCPCNSGINIQQCCGKLIKRSRFGRFTAQ